MCLSLPLPQLPPPFPSPPLTPRALPPSPQISPALAGFAPGEATAAPTPKPSHDPPFRLRRTAPRVPGRIPSFFPISAASVFWYIRHSIGAFLHSLSRGTSLLPHGRPPARPLAYSPARPLGGLPTAAGPHRAVPLPLRCTRGPVRGPSLSLSLSLFLSCTVHIYLYICVTPGLAMPRGTGARQSMSSRPLAKSMPLSHLRNSPGRTWALSRPATR